MKSTKFSIIICVYNKENYIEKCVNSCLKQTYDNFEIIIVDDGSTDKSLKLIKKLYSNNKKIKIICKKNTGVADSRNIGITKATGDYITFLDADDWLNCEFLRFINNSILSNSEVDIVETNLKLVDDTGLILKDSMYDDMVNSIIDNKNKKIELINSTISINYYGKKFYNNRYGNCRCIGGKVYRKSLITHNNINFSSNLKIFEDGIFNLYCYNSSKKIILLNSKLYNYRQNNTSITHSNKIDTIEQVKNIIFELEKFVENRKYNNRKPIIYSSADLISYSMTRIVQKYKLRFIISGLKQYKLISENFSSYINDFLNQKKYITIRYKFIFNCLKHKKNLIPYIYFYLKTIFKKM